MKVTYLKGVIKMKNSNSRKKVLRYVGLAVLFIVILLLIPYVFREKPDRSISGPDLSEMEYTEIFFENGDLQLAGMLIVPEGEGPFPAAVFVHGSGTSRRNSPWYLSVAKHLQEHGIAVLLPDKRGSEKSEGDWRTASFQDLAGDTIRAIEFVRDQEQFDVSYIGVVGFSQGGWIAPIVAAESQDVSFVVSMSGSGVTTDEQLLYEEINNEVEMGTYRFIAKMIAPMVVKSIKEQEFWKLNSGFDPIPYWEDVNVPAFAALGGDDTNVPVEESVKRFEEVDQVIIKVYPGLGHGIVDPETHKVLPEYLNDLTEFIQTKD
jgi:dipeptidyl aminopeptidase/acylaminoacyl peptidase